MHVYWLLNTPIDITSSEDRERVEGVVRRINSLIGGDPVQDLSRLLRLPGFPNVKDARNGSTPVPCSLVFLNDHRYELDEIAEYIPPEETMPLVIPSGETEQTQQLTPEIEAYVKQRLEQAADDRSVRDFGLVCDLIRVGWGREAARQLVERYSKFGDRGADYFDRTWEAAQERVAQRGNGATSSAGPVPRPPGPVGRTFSDILADLGERVRTGTPVVRVLPCGLALIEETTGGLVCGEYLGLFGGPSVGKSTLGDQIVVGTLQMNPDASAIIFGLETSASVRAARLVAANAVKVDQDNAIVRQLPVKPLLAGELHPSGQATATEVIECLTVEIGERLRIVDDVYLAGDVARIIEQERPAVVVIDHLGLILTESREENETARVDTALGRLVAAIRRAGIAAVIINELNKEGLAATRGSRGCSR